MAARVHRKKPSILVSNDDGIDAPGLARMLHEQGKGLVESALESAKLRFRPILMTSIAFIFGVLPLAVAVGAGANARHSIGTGIIGGMIGEATLAMLYVPLFFYIFDRWSEGSGEKKGKNRAKGNSKAIV